MFQLPGDTLTRRAKIALTVRVGSFAFRWVSPVTYLEVEDKIDELAEEVQRLQFNMGRYKDRKYSPMGNPVDRYPHRIQCANETIIDLTALYEGRVKDIPFWLKANIEFPSKIVHKGGKIFRQFASA